MRRLSARTPLDRGSLESDTVADALIDKLTLTCRLTFAPQTVGGIDGLRARLATAGIIARGNGVRADVVFRWRCPASRAELWLGGVLTFVKAADGSVLAGGASNLDVSPLRLLREQVSPVCGAGLDGEMNVVGPPEDDRPRLLGLQLETVSGLLDEFIHACAVASGSPVAMDLWVRAAEMSRDIPRVDAVAVAHRLVGEPNPWYRVARVRHYRDAADTVLDGNYATVTWPNDRADAPVRMKFYAKRADLLRIEVCFDNRDALRLAGGWGGEQWPGGSATEGAGVAESLAILARATVPLLDAMAAHVGRLDAPQREVLDLVVALAPLMRAAAPPPPRRPGARPGAQTQADVRDVLYHLLVLGRYDASGLRTNSTVRKALDRIAAEGGLLSESLGRAPLYTVEPSFAGARAALRLALWPDQDAEPPG